MITPLFRVEQDDRNIYVIIRVINTGALKEEMEIWHHDKEFIFYGRPYYLRLEFSHDIQSNEEMKDGYSMQVVNNSTLNDVDKEPEKIIYNSDTNELRIFVPKKQFGQHFENLDMIGELLAKPKMRPNKKLIEVVKDIPFDDNQEQNDDDDDDQFDWTIEQKLPTDESVLEQMLGKLKYGFANSYSSVVEKADQEYTAELFDIEQPGHKDVWQRRLERWEKENKDFKAEHYLADLYDDEDIIPIINSKSPWQNNNATILTDQDRERIIDQLPRIEFLKFDKETKKALMLSICDILFAYAYDLRTNDWEHTVESCWTIRKLSPTLTCFEHWLPQKNSNFDNDLAMFMLVSCIRRSLTYPLYRNWKLSLTVANDMIDLLKKGQTEILKCFLG